MKSLSLVILLGVMEAYAAPSQFDVTAYGARGDGKTNDAAAIQKAIDACARNGGGIVYLPPGNFLSGTITLKSNITFYLEAGATLWGSRQMSDFDPPHLIYAQGAENIAIEGRGTINGNGDAYWYPDFRPHERRPSPLIELVECRNVRIQGIRIRNTPGWAIHPLECDGVWITGISIVTPMQGPNTDGIDPDSSRNVFISDSYIETGDDCIVLKTTGRRGAPVRACENVSVTNCVLISDDTALKLGTESLGDFRHCTFSNCVIRGTRVGLGI
jgi:polygalacturonase